MRIVLISSEYPPNQGMGGIATNAATVAPALARRGHDVHVLTVGKASTVVEDGVTVRAVASVPHLWRLAASAVAARLRPDIVQSAEWGAEAWLVARATRIPVVTRLATPSHVIRELNHIEAGVGSKVLTALERDQTRHSDAVFAPTAAIIKLVADDWDLDPAKIECIGNPIDVAAIRRAGEGPPPLGLPERFVVYIGGLERRKGLDELGEAAAVALGADPDLHLVCVGYPGPDDVMRDFRRRTRSVSERVHVVGEFPRADALAIVARAELMVCPSRWESFGYVCVEALALGRPVIATDVGGFAEILDHGTTGWLVPPGDAASLTVMVTHVLNNPVERNRVAASGARRAEDFDVDVLIDRQVELYERACNARGRSFVPGIYQEGYRRHFDPEGPTEIFADLYAAKRRAVVERLLVEPSGRLLDAGGGYGRFASLLEQRHAVTLCDLSPEMVAEARLRLAPTTGVIRADGSRLPFADASFSMVLAMDLAVHLLDLASGVRELARVLKPGGILVFDTTNAAPGWVFAYPRYWGYRPDRLVRTLAAGGVSPAWRKVVHHQRSAEVRGLISEAGLTLEAMTPFGPRWSPKWHLWWLRKPT